METIKRNFFQRIKLAIFNVEKYQEIALEKFSEAIKYFFKIVFTLSIIVSLFATLKFGLLANFFIDTFKNDFPEFTFKDNTLVASEVVNTVKESKQLQLKLIVDTNAETNEEINNYITQISDYSNGAIFLKDRLIISIGGLAGQATYNYSDFNTQDWNELTKQSLLDTINNVDINTVCIAFFISITLYLFLAYMISIIIEMLLIAVIGFITSKIVKLNMKFTQICSMAIYSMTLSILLSALYTPVKLLTGFNMEYFSIMYTLIPYVYIITAILMSRSEIIKQQVEIGKIEKVQKEVKEELKENEEKEKQEQEKKKKEEKQKEKEEKEKNGEEPEGSEA